MGLGLPQFIQRLIISSTHTHSYIALILSHFPITIFQYPKRDPKLKLILFLFIFRFIFLLSSSILSFFFSPASSLSPLFFLFLFTELVVNYSVSRCASLLISAAGRVRIDK